MIAPLTRALAIVLGGLLLVGTAPRDAAAFGHSGGGFHGGGGWHGGWGWHVGFGFGCCWGGGPWGGYWPGYWPYGYGYPYAYPAYVPPVAYAPPVIGGGAAPAGYVSPTSASVSAAPSTTSFVPASASATVAPPAVAGSGECREFQSTVQIDGKPQRAFGTVCRQPDGSWRIR